MEILATGILGLKIMSMHSNGQQEELINVSHLPAGVHVVEAYYNNSHWQQKLVVEH